MKTVGELRKALEAFPDDARLVIDGPDIGGYDVTHLPEAQLKTLDDLYHPQNDTAKRFKAFQDKHGVLLCFVGGVHTGKKEDKDWWKLLDEEGL